VDQCIDRLRRRRAGEYHAILLKHIRRVDVELIVIDQANQIFNIEISRVKGAAEKRKCCFHGKRG
jgi:hypothetical protein